MKITVKHYVGDVGVEISVEDSSIQLKDMQNICAGMLAVANGNYSQYLREQAAGVTQIPISK